MKNNVNAVESSYHSIVNKKKAKIMANIYKCGLTSSTTKMGTATNLEKRTNCTKQLKCRVALECQFPIQPLQLVCIAKLRHMISFKNARHLAPTVVPPIGLRTFVACK